MGKLTATTIISEGLLLAGDDSLTDRALVWLNAWLRSQYRAWPWPFLYKRATGVALAAGTTSLAVGGGSGGISDDISRVLDSIYLYNSAYTYKGRVRLRQLIGGHVDNDETANDPSTNTGTPTALKVRASTTWGAWNLIPTPVPDKAYLLAFDYLYQPANIVAGDTPIYPNDRTMIQAVAVQAWQYMEKDRRYVEGMQVLGTMTIDDRVKYGEVGGTNDRLDLDSDTFR